MKKGHYLLFLTALGVVILDQLTKYLVVRFIPIHGSITIVEGFFDLVHVRNRGMAFGLMNSPDMDAGSYLLTAATLAAVILLVLWFRSMPGKDGGLILGISLILGGAAGNLIDRLRLREVIDFLDLYIGTWHWPAFNMADSAITVGTLLVSYRILFRSAG